MSNTPGITSPRPADNPRSRLMMAFIAGWIVVAICLAGVFSTGSEHRADLTMLRLAQTMFCYGLGCGAALAASRLALRGVWSLNLGYTLIAAMTVAGIGMVINLSGYCQFPGSWEIPFFGEAEDFSREWMRIAYHKSTGGYLPGTNIGFTAIASLAVNRLGPGVGGLLILNIMMLCGTLAASANLATVLLPGKEGRKTAFYAALATALPASAIWYATVPLKETGATFAFTLFALAIAKLYKGRPGLSGIVAAATGGFLIMLLKSPLAWFLVAGIVITVLRTPIRNNPAARRTITTGICLLLIAGAAGVGGSRFRYVSDMVLIGAEENQKVGLHDYMTSYKTVERYSSLIPGYFEGSATHRLAYLPLATVSQFFPPFPWNYTRDTDEGKFVWYAHLSFLWYLTAGLAIGYYALCLWRRKPRGGLGTWALWFLLCFMGVAYYSGGTVARYYLPFVPCMIPLALRFLQCAREGLISMKATRAYGAVYVILLGVALVSAYMFLQC